MVFKLFVNKSLKNPYIEEYKILRLAIIRYGKPYAIDL